MVAIFLVGTKSDWHETCNSKKHLSATSTLLHSGNLSMLVLTRKSQEQIRIGRDIIVTVVRIKGQSVRLGIQAPTEIPVLRGELEFHLPAEALEDEEESACSSYSSLS